jgi:amidase
VKNFATTDATVASNLRSAGAIILGKTNLSEWANFRSDRSISGWSAVGGLTKNPHVLDRSACGSSAGSGASVAALFAAASVGTETDGSITCPASINGVVGLKPTHGLLAQKGIVPISHSQDTAGPMTRSITDAAAMLSAMVDSSEVCSHRVKGCKIANYLSSLSTTSLEGKRVGVWRFRPGRHAPVDALFEQALKVLRDAGATLVELQVPDNVRTRSAEDTVLVTEFKIDLNAYLESTPPAVAVRSLEQLISFNASNARETALFNQELFVRSNATKGLEDPAYRTALADSKRLAGEEGIGKLLSGERLEFIVAPTTGPSWRIDLVSGDQFPGSFSSLPAISGYPHLTLPMGLVRSLPVGISFIGPPWSESMLLSAAFAFEQRTKVDVRAQFKSTIEVDGEPALQSEAARIVPEKNWR